MGTNPCTPCDSRTTSHGCVRADVNVVSYLDQVIKFDAIFDHCVIQSATVYASVGANLDIVADANRPKLFNFFPSTIKQGEAKAISTDHHARMHDTALPNHTILANSD